MVTDQLKFIKCNPEGKVPVKYGNEQLNLLHYGTFNYYIIYHYLHCGAAIL